MKFRRKVKLMKGTSYHIMVVLAIVDDTFDLVAATVSLLGPLIIAAITTAAGALAGGAATRGVVCYFDWTCAVAGNTAEVAGNLVGGVAGLWASSYIAPTLGLILGYLLTGLAFLLSMFVGFTIIMYYAWHKVSFTSKKLATLGMAIVIELTPILGALIPATTISLLVMHHYHNKEQKKKMKKQLKKDVKRRKEKELTEENLIGQPA